MSATKPAQASTVDPTIAAFENARPLDEPLSTEEIAALEKAMADEEPVLTSEELLEQLRPKP